MAISRYISALLLILSAIIPGSSYAAFPIAHHNTTTAAATIHATANMPAQPASPRPAHRRIRGKSQAWALVICCLAGYVGAHRYYLGYILEGCIQTVTLGGMGVWWIIDLIRICTGDLQPKDGQYMAHFHWH